MILVTVALMAMQTETRRHARFPCLDPPDVKVQLTNLYKGLRLYNSRGFTTFNIIPEFRKSFQNNAMKLKSKSKTHHINHGERKCYKMHVNRRNHFVKYQKNMSFTCPWYIKLDYDADRLPNRMAKAECTCRRCYNPLYRNSSGKCQTVESFIPVIRRKCVRGMYKYFATVETVPVGCTCVRHATRQKIVSPE